MANRSLESIYLPLPALLLLGLLSECTDIYRYIGDLEQEIKNLQNEIAASKTTNSLTGTPLPFNMQQSVYSNPQITQRDILPERREGHSSNFVEGGGIR